MSAVRSLRRGWCPGALRPMETGDGLIVRIHPKAGRLAAGDLRLVAQLARSCGNGLVDLTSRGNVQMRGVTAERHPQLVAALVAGGLAAFDEGPGPLRLTLASPLAGLDPLDRLDVARLAAKIEAAGRALAGLPPKCLVVIDGGGLSPGDAACDLRLQASDGGGVIVVCGESHAYATDATATGAACIAFLRLLAEHQGEEDDIPRRMRAIPADAVEALAKRLGLGPVAPPPVRAATWRVGVAPEAGGTFSVLASASFGRVDAERLEALASLADRLGARDIRPTPWRGVALTGLADPQAALAGLAVLGLIVDPADPRLAFDACPGAPACSRGEAPAQDDAAVFAAALTPQAARHFSFHVSGCAKGCARPRPASVTLVASGGLYGVVPDGRAGDRPALRLSAGEIARRLALGGDPRFLLSGPAP